MSSRLKRLRSPLAVFALISVSLFVAMERAVAVSDGGTVTLESRAFSGAPSQGGGVEPVISDDGRYVVFRSEGADLVPGDTNGTSDIFVRDRAEGVTRRASVASDGMQSEGQSHFPAIARDAPVVCFNSRGSNLAPGLTSVDEQVFVHYIETGITKLASSNDDGETADQTSSSCSLSSDGRFVAFSSSATNLVASDTNGKVDVFVKDLDTGTVVLASISSSGEQGDGISQEPSISSDGHLVAFQSSATNLAPGNNNDIGGDDIFVRDLVNGTTTFVSVSSTGEGGDSHSFRPTISADGTWIAFGSVSTNLDPVDDDFVVDVFIRDLNVQTTTLVSKSSAGVAGNDVSLWPVFSGVGNAVVFMSLATNLVPEDTNDRWDIFSHDPISGITKRVSLTPTGEQLDGGSVHPAMGGGGRFMTFVSDASNLGSWDGHEVGQVYVFDHGTCDSGAAEEGALTGPLHQAIEPASGPLEGTVHELSCFAANVGL